MDTASAPSRTETSARDRAPSSGGLGTFLDMVRNAPELTIGNKVFRVLTDPYTGEWVVRNFGGDHFCLRLKPETTLETIPDIVRASIEGKSLAQERGQTFLSARCRSLH